MADPTSRDLGQLVGAYQMCERLLTSPVFNKTQREVIAGQAALVQAELEKAGVKFTEGSNE